VNLSRLCVLFTLLPYGCSNPDLQNAWFGESTTAYIYQQMPLNGAACTKMGCIIDNDGWSWIVGEHEAGDLVMETSKVDEPGKPTYCELDKTKAADSKLPTFRIIPNAGRQATIHTTLSVHLPLNFNGGRLMFAITAYTVIGKMKLNGANFERSSSAESPLKDDELQKTITEFPSEKSIIESGVLKVDLQLKAEAPDSRSTTCVRVTDVKIFKLGS